MKKPTERESRLAEALRRNLRRRKEQARRKDGDEPRLPASEPEEQD